MSHRLALLVLVPVVSGCRAPAPADAPPLTAATRIAAQTDSLLRDLAGRDLFQGAVVVGRGDSVVFEGGFGFADRAAGLTFTPDTKMDAASIAKTATAAALLTLADEGRVDLEATVQSVLPEYPHAATRIRHLLAHSAGLPGYDWLDTRAPAGEVRTNASHLALVAADAGPPSFPPGSAFRYDNVAYDVAAMVVEKTAGEPYGRFLTKRLLMPAGVGAVLRPARLADWTGPRARGYRRSAAGWEDLDSYDLEGFHGAANLYFSARDLQRWAAGYPRAVSAAVLQRARVPAALDDGRRTGVSLGSFYTSADGQQRYYTGHHQGFFSVSYADDAQGISIGWVANDEPPVWLQMGLTRALIAIALGRAPEQLVAPPAADTAADPAGSYPLPGLGTVTVARAGDELAVVVRDVEYQAFGVAPGVYYVPGVDAALQFRANERGNTVIHWDAVLTGPLTALRGPGR